MRYKKYTVEDFLADPEFVDWIASPNRENQAFWEKVSGEIPEKRKDIQLASEILKSLNSEVDQQEMEEDSRNIWNAILPLLQSREIDQSNSLNRTKRQTRMLWTRVAASILLVVGLSWWMYPIITQQAQEESQMIAKSNPKGRKLKITLKDGSVVTLNSESKIKYAENFGVGNRMIFLDGEAFFEVRKNEDLPFVVKTDEVTTTALGTSFNISNFRSSDQIVISLATGKIRVESNDSPSSVGLVTNYLEPGDHISYDRKSRKFQKWYEEESHVFLWKDGIIGFDRADLTEIVGYLERWYDVKFLVTGQASETIRYSGTFDNESLEKVLIGISYSLNFEFNIIGKQVSINFPEAKE